MNFNLITERGFVKTSCINAATMSGPDACNMRHTNYLFYKLECQCFTERGFVKTSCINAATMSGPDACNMRHTKYLFYKLECQCL